MSHTTILVPVRAVCEACAGCDRLSIEGEMEYDPGTKTNTMIWVCKRLDFCLDVRATLLDEKFRERQEAKE